MAAASTALRLCARAIARPRPAPAFHARPLPQFRTLTSTPLRWRPAKNPDEEDVEAAEPEETSSDDNFVETMLGDIPAEDRGPEMEADLEQLRTRLEKQESNMHSGLDEMEAKLFKDPRPQRDSFWFDEEDDDPTTEDVVGDEFDEDDIPTMAHGKLDEVRKYRHYARIVAWEMPMLAKLAKPFEPPKEEQVLRYRYTTYLGEFHPAQRKVVVTFCPSDLGLPAEQELKLKKLAGPRYNPERDEVKMSCESFDHQAQNKRYLSDQIDKLIEAAKDTTDTFADVPLDLRHHPIKPKPKFPVEWRLTEDRKKELDEMRAASLARDVKRGEEGKLIDGSAVLQQLLKEPAPAPARERERERVLVGARRR